MGNIPKLTLYVSRSNGSHAVGRVCDIHYHDEIELLVMYSGKMKCITDNEALIAKAGDVIFVNSGVPHYTEILENNTISGMIQFKKRSFINTDVPEILTYSATPVPVNEKACAVISNAEFFAAADELINESHDMETGYDMFILSSIYRVIGYLYREHIISVLEGIHDTREVRKVLPILKYINTNYNEDITLEAASEMLSFDPSYFCRIFKIATGATFTEYLNFVRIYKSEKLLRGSEKSILEISEAVGFSSVSYFNRIFKKHKGFSPRFYRSAKSDGTM